MLSKVHHVKENKESGFTLIEILVVIAIMGIIAALTVPSFLNQRKSAIDDEVKVSITNAAKQIETWRVRYPAKPIPKGTFGHTTNQKGEPITRNEFSTLPFKNLKVKENKEIEITISPIIGKPGNYTIVGKSIRGKKAARTTGIVYDTTKGGLQP